jgi:hypothetical protein
LLFVICYLLIDGNTIAQNAIGSWYGEVSAYDYSNPGFSGNTGHFTQVVWKNSIALGCGVAQGPITYAGWLKGFR